MTAPALTPEQRAAVETRGSLVVRAGAGSGKTAVLAARYVRLVCGESADEALGVEQVLAVTFTEKAAAEMRSRIRDLLAARVASADGMERQRLLRVQRALAAARIGTIHALAAGLLRASPLESGTHPGAAVLDEIEGPTYVEREVRRVLLARLRAGDPDVRHCAEAWGFGANGDEAALIAIVRDVLEATVRKGVTIGDLLPALARQEAAATTAATDLRRDAEHLVRLIDGWLAEEGRATRAVAARVDAVRARWPAWRAALLRLEGSSDVATLLALRDLPAEAGRAFRKRADWTECATRIGFKLQDGAPRFTGTIAAAFGCCQGLPLAAALTRIVQIVDAALAAAKRRDGVLTFDDLIAGARTLLADEAAAARLTAGLRAILVDEFQDTDPAQADLLRRLASGGAELFVVGDEKQSIYRFRGAEVQLFTEMRDTLGRELPLADNFRSRPPLLAFVNGLAARLFAARRADAPWRVRWSPDQRLRPRRLDPTGRTGNVADGAARPLVRLKSLVNEISDGDPELLAAAARALEARVVAATITELLGDGWRAGDIAVLMPALTQVKAYEYALRRWAVPYEVVRGRGFYQCQEVRDVVHLLAAVVDPDDGIALAGALRSPLFALSDASLARLAAVPGGLTARFTAGERFADMPPRDADDAAAALRLILELRADRDRRPLAELITAALEATQFEAVLCGQFHGSQKVANVRKLVAQARAFERRRFFSMREFVAQTRRLLARESHEPEAPRLASAADAVQVMTIHQAKGLEFPVVILPDLGREPPRDYRSPVLVDRAHGILAIPSFGTGRYRLPHRLVDEQRREDLDREDAERARLLYVACTRARDLLILCEGKGRRSFLAVPVDEGREDQGRTWCQQLWSYLGREAIAEFVAGPHERVVVDARGEGPDGEPVPVAVEIEKSAALLARVPPPERDPVEARLADVAGARPLPEEMRAVARVYDDVPRVASEVVVSPTALADFVRCPRQFWYRHVRALPEHGVRALAVPDEGVADGVRLGLAAHAVLEVLDFDLPRDARAAAVGAALDAMPEIGDAERAEIEHDLVAALTGLADDVPTVYGREVPFCLPVNDPASLFIRGRIDLVGGRGERMVVRDYKYARPGDAEAYRTQMEVYALAVAAAHPARPIDVEIEWLRAPGGRTVLAVDLDDARARVRGAAHALVPALDVDAAPAFPQAFTDPGPCRVCGCPFIARCFARTERRR